MDALLLAAHTRAVVIGRTHAGDDAPEEADDRRFAEEVMVGEGHFLSGLRSDLENGRYTVDGVRDGEAVAQRAGLYVNRACGTANQAWALALDPEEALWWILGAEDDSTCEDCPAIADGSPYPAGVMDLWPGSNQTTCRQNCRCRIETADGSRGFSLP